MSSSPSCSGRPHQVFASMHTSVSSSAAIDRRAKNPYRRCRSASTPASRPDSPKSGRVACCPSPLHESQIGPPVASATGDPHHPNLHPPSTPLPCIATASPASPPAARIAASFLAPPLESIAASLLAPPLESAAPSSPEKPRRQDRSELRGTPARGRVFSPTMNRCSCRIGAIITASEHARARSHLS